MARRRTAPRPPSENSPKLVALGAGALWRVHSSSYRATQFNPSNHGDARFSPIGRPDGTTIPVLYGASTLAGAMMETVFHDVPTPPGGYILDIDALGQQHLVVSRIRPKRRLQAVDLSVKGLKRLGLRRTDLIDTPVTAYPRTREWAAWFHTATRAKGLLWTSRQDDAARAVALFGDRLPESAFKIEVDREPLCQDEHLDALLELAEHIGIEQLFGL
ncbi:MAG TPA: RES family NAD+ phosphorylase [Steroidobacteraceae bacterium]